MTSVLEPTAGRPRATADPASTGDVDPREPGLRLAALVDPGSLELVYAGGGAGVVTGRGTVDGIPVVAYCTDATRMGGAIGEAECPHIVEAIDLAVAHGCPVIGVWHSGGAKLAEGVSALDAIGQVFHAMVRASGKVPQLSVVLGPAAGGAAYGPALTDVVIMSTRGRVFVTGPDIVASVTGEKVDMEELGGPVAHGTRSGVVHVTTDTDAEAVEQARALTRLLGRHGRHDPELVADGEDLSRFLPAAARRAYDVRPVVSALLDDGDHVELQARWAPNMTVSFGRLGGRTVGVLANNPLRKGGCLDSASAEKAARFVRMCDAFGVPMVVLVDVPGYLPGVDQEWGGVVRRGAKLLHAFAEAVVPRVTLVLRKSYGGAYIAMNATSLGATAVYAWPQAEVAVMGAKAAVGILHRKKLAAAPDEEREALHDELAAEHERVSGGVTRALDIGAVHEVIEPTHTRRRIADRLAQAGPARGRHTNIPL